MLNNASILWHSIGTISLVIAVLAKAPTHQSAKFVFTQFIDGTGDPGWGTRASHAYVAVIGILLAQYTMSGRYRGVLTLRVGSHRLCIGFDASAHVGTSYLISPMVTEIQFSHLDDRGDT
jgi:hypothetical protein